MKAMTTMKKVYAKKPESKGSEQNVPLSLLPTTLPVLRFKDRPISSYHLNGTLHLPECLVTVLSI